MSEEKDEKGRDEKQQSRGFGEKGSQDRLGSAVGGLILIWLGICFIMVTSGPWAWDDVWSYFLGGMGVIFLLEVVLRLLLPSYRRGAGSHRLWRPHRVRDLVAAGAHHRRLGYCHRRADAFQGTLAIDLELAWNTV